MAWFKKHPQPDFWMRYKNTFLGKQPNELSAIRFVLFDTETTGLNLNNDRILSIGAVSFKDGVIKISDQFECYLEQSVFNSQTVAIHGLVRTGKHHKMDEFEALERFLNYIKNAVLVAHHAAFDVGMINNVLKRHHLPKLKNTVLDTSFIYKKTKSQSVSDTHYSLDYLIKEFHIPEHDRHTASGDAYITALLFAKLLSLLKNKHPDLNLSHLKTQKKRIGLL